MDPRIEEFIRANRRTYTREAIRQRLIDSGHDPADIDATWEMLDAADPDEAGVAGPGFWGRWLRFVIGLNVAVLLLVALTTGMFTALASYGVLLIVLAVALTIGALISWGIVAAVGPENLGRTSATVIGAVVPLVFALFIGGTCYALTGSLGPPLPAPLTGTVTLRIDPPLAIEASGAVACQAPPTGERYYSVYTQTPLSSSESPVHVSINAFPETLGGELVPTVGITLEGPNGPIEYQATQGGGSGTDAAAGSSPTSGLVTFQNFRPVEAVDEFGRPIDRFQVEAISGTVAWTCE